MLRSWKDVTLMGYPWSKSVFGRWWCYGGIVGRYVAIWACGIKRREPSGWREQQSIRVTFNHVPTCFAWQLCFFAPVMVYHVMSARMCSLADLSVYNRTCDSWRPSITLFIIGEYCKYLLQIRWGSAWQFQNRGNLVGECRPFTSTSRVRLFESSFEKACCPGVIVEQKFLRSSMLRDQKRHGAISLALWQIYTHSSWLLSGSISIVMWQICL